MANLNLPQDCPTFQLPEDSPSPSVSVASPHRPVSRTLARLNGNADALVTRGTTAATDDSLVTDPIQAPVAYAR
jgi:hypothetical protein